MGIIFPCSCSESGKCTSYHYRNNPTNIAADFKLGDKVSNDGKMILDKN